MLRVLGDLLALLVLPPGAQLPLFPSSELLRFGMKGFDHTRNPPTLLGLVPGTWSKPWDDAVNSFWHFGSLLLLLASVFPSEEWLGLRG